MASDLHRTATTAYPCYVPILGESAGAGRVGLAECKYTIFWGFCNDYQLEFRPMNPAGNVGCGLRYLQTGSGTKCPFPDGTAQAIHKYALIFRRYADPLPYKAPIILRSSLFLSLKIRDGTDS